MQMKKKKVETMQTIVERKSPSRRCNKNRDSLKLNWTKIETLYSPYLH